MKTCVVISFFSPVSYMLPIRHLHTTVQVLNAQGIDLVVTQAIYPGQSPVRMPTGIPQGVYDTKSLLFHKERLWNLGARLVDSENIIFLDSDVLFHSKDWIAKCEEALDVFDIIQPYSVATWLGVDGKPEYSREPMAKAIERGVAPTLKSYHPGFGWGMKRSTFETLGGFFDFSVAGNSDTLFGLSLRKTVVAEKTANWIRCKQDASVGCDSFVNYKKRACSLKLKVGTPKDVEVLHMWHGYKSDRQYVSRTPLFTRRLGDGEFAVHDEPNGLQAWDNLKKSNASVLPYFVNKKDDGNA